ncbi:MAG: DUF4965 domain-containing protein [Clostridia bacterium]|nr:DUF4965 domain-containing protein [Clostridia bacterium]
MERKLAAYPLFVKDPYFSIWADNEEINKTNPIFWVGNKKVMRAYVEADGEQLVFFGEGGDKLVQTEIKTEGYSTVCLFESEILDLKAEFLSPLFIDDLEALSRPVCYLKYEIEPKKRIKEAKIVFEVEERISYDTAIEPDRKEHVRAAVIAFDGFECAYLGLERQMHLSIVNDVSGADWGYWYVSGENCFVKEENGYKYIVGENTFADGLHAEERAQGFFMFAFDDIISLNYFGRPLVGYYFRDGKTITDALEEAYADAYETFARAENYKKAYHAEWKKLGKTYATLCHASLVQTIGAHKLAYDYKTGNTVFISRENGSAGCAATVDVTYPSAPLFLKYNPELLRGMLYPIFEFAKSKVWEDKNFAPHDAGMYPLCYGEFYSLRNKGGKYLDKIADIPWEPKVRSVTLPKIYNVKRDMDYYNPDRQMPVEESADVLIVAYAAYKEDGKTQMLKENFALMKRWADYLFENGKMPENQLSTDDFCGRKAKNINLTLKAIVGLYAFAGICEALKEDGSVYEDKAREIARFVEDFCSVNEYMPATFDDEEEGMYSLKYNLAFDLYFRANLFEYETFKKEAACYRENMFRYGVKLYSDIKDNSTKTDWLAFVSCFGGEDYREEIYEAIARSMRETKRRLPFCDWYSVDTAEPCGCVFRARSVQGGIFMPLLCLRED